MMIDSAYRTFSFMFLAFTVAFVAMPQAQAQNVPTSSRPAPQNQAPVPNQSMPPSDEEVTILRDDYAGKYNMATLQNLSKLYWRLGAFDLEDNMAVSNYLKINDCKIFTEYLNDDLEWKEIVNVMKGHLKDQRMGFPLNYQFLLQIRLGRYDPVQGGFPLVERTGFIDAKRIEVDSVDRNREVCHDASAIKDYPKSMVILLPQPFSLNFLKMDEHVAQAYILRKKSEFSKLAEEVRLRSYERDAYLRLRITFSQYHGNLRGENNQTMSILFGNIDGYEIFEDNGQKRLMMSVDMKKEAAAIPQMSMPAQAEVTAPAHVPAETTTVTTTTTIVETKPDAAPVQAIPAIGFSQGEGGPMVVNAP